MKQKKQDFFFEKKKQKTFASCAGSTLPARSRMMRRQKVKVFWFFSSEKNILSGVLTPW